MGHAKDSPEPGRGVPEASGARGGRAEPLEKALAGRRKAKRPNVDSRIRAEDPPLAGTVVPIELPGHRVHLLAPPAQDLGAVGGVVDELRWAVELEKARAPVEQSVGCLEQRPRVLNAEV